MPSLACGEGNEMKRSKANKKFVNSYFYQCGRKSLFLDENSAVARVQSIRDRSGVKMRVYKCNHCNGWHLAREKEGQK